MLSGLGVVLVLAGIFDLIFPFITRVGAVPLIFVGVILYVVGNHGGGWYHRGPPA